MFIDVSLGKSQIEYSYMNLFLIFFPISYMYVQRGSAYAILLGGWSFAAYLIQFTCGHLKELMVNQYQWVIGYLVIVGGFLGVKDGFLSPWFTYDSPDRSNGADLVITRLRKNLSANQMIMVDLLIQVVDDSEDHMKRMPG